MLATCKVVFEELSPDIIEKYGLKQNESEKFDDNVKLPYTNENENISEEIDGACSLKVMEESNAANETMNGGNITFIDLDDIESDNDDDYNIVDYVDLVKPKKHHKKMMIQRYLEENEQVCELNESYSLESK